MPAKGGVALSALLELKGVAVSYGARTVIQNVSFSVEPGELCVLLGLNGSGKSTLLKAICGLIPCRGGSLRASGVPLLRLRERERARLLSYIPQRPGPAPTLSVLDVVLMGLHARLGLLESPTAAQRELARQTLERVGLPGAAERLYGQLSEGQRQLVIFARALVQDAPVMLMDEPDSALDFVNRRQVLERIARLVRDEGRAGLITLHDPNSALAYGDRLLLLKDGVLVGDLSVHDASLDALERALSLLYGPIRVFRQDGRLFVS